MATQLRRTVLSLVLATGLVLPVAALHAVAKADQGTLSGPPDLSGVTSVQRADPAPEASNVTSVVLPVGTGADQGAIVGTSALNGIVSVQTTDPALLPSDFTPIMTPAVDITWGS